jgi:trimethylamine-N-oxide reductase (cytochrome c)
MKPIKTKDKTVLRALGLGGYFGGGAEGMVDVKDGKIVRVRPMQYGWKYDKSEVRQWKITRDGKSIEPSWKSLPGAFSLAYKKRVYSPNRVKFPMKRVDWDPNGERNPQNRGKSKFKRISWDEAAEIISSEIKRIHKKYGPHAILLQGDGHGECKTLNTPHGHPGVLLEYMGGFTLQVRNPDRWEGWYWGTKHVWGQRAQGIMFPAANIVKDATERRPGPPQSAACPNGPSRPWHANSRETPPPSPTTSAAALSGGPSPTGPAGMPPPGDAGPWRPGGASAPTDLFRHAAGERACRDLFL